MDSLSSVSPPLFLPPHNSLRCRIHFFPRFLHHHRVHPLPSSLRHTYSRGNSPPKQLTAVTCCGGDGGEDAEINDPNDEAERAIQLDGEIPGTSGEFVKRVSSRAYDMRRNLHQTFDSSSYEVLEANPWREMEKPVYVLTHGENQLCTMKTRSNRSEVERELGELFSREAKPRSERENKAASPSSTNFQMLVEDIREGVLVFEDQIEAVRYCELMQGRGQGCEGVVEIEASSVFDLCRKMSALAVLFRRGRTPPLPEDLQLNLKARKLSLEDE